MIKVNNWQNFVELKGDQNHVPVPLLVINCRHYERDENHKHLYSNIFYKYSLKTVNNTFINRCDLNVNFNVEMLNKIDV